MYWPLEKKAETGNSDIALFKDEFARGLLRHYSPTASHMDVKKLKTALMFNSYPDLNL